MPAEHGTPRPCPLCTSEELRSVFYPPLVQCRACGLVFRTGPECPEPLGAAYDVHYADVVRDQRVQDRRTPLYLAFLDRHRPPPGRNRLLDVGCGSGRFLLLAGARGWDVLGLDVSEVGVATARANGVPTRVGSLATVSLPESSFDVVTLWNVLDWVSRPLELARATRRVLTPGGTLFVRVPNLSFQAGLHRVGRALCWCPPAAAGLSRQRFFGHVSFSRRTLEQVLTGAGFREVRVTNSLATYGDPYPAGPYAGDRAFHWTKLAVRWASAVVAACSGGKLLLGTSLWATAVNAGPESTS